MKDLIFIVALVIASTSHARKEKEDGSQVRRENIELMGFSFIGECLSSSCHLTYATNQDGASSLVTIMTNDRLEDEGCRNVKLGKDAFGKRIKLPQSCEVRFRLNSWECKCQGNSCEGAFLSSVDVRQSIQS